MENSRECRLTPKGLAMMPSSLKDKIKLLTQKKRLNPGKTPTFRIIKMLGGVPRLAEEAEKLDIGVLELTVMAESYINGR